MHGSLAPRPACRAHAGQLQPDLRIAAKKEQIAFDPPLEEDRWGEASVDLRLPLEQQSAKPRESGALATLARPLETNALVTHSKIRPPSVAYLITSPIGVRII